MANNNDLKIVFASNNDLEIIFNDNEIPKMGYYPRIYDFTDSYENGNFAGIKCSVNAKFFQKYDKNFDTIQELYEHCVAIMR